MAKVTYTCTFSSALAFNAHPSASLSGPSSTIPSNAIITNVEFEVYCGVGTYNYDADCCATLTDSSGSTFDVDSTCNTGSENRIWAKWDESVSASESASMDWNNLETVGLSGTDELTVRTGYEATLEIEYVEIEDCTPPTSVTVSPTTVDAGTEATLSWLGAKAGAYNSIANYVVYRSTSADGTYSLLGTYASSVSSCTVTAPGTMGSSYYYKVAVVDGHVGTLTTSTVYATLTARTYTACSAPTSVSAGTTNVAPGAKVTLSWSGADEGTNNAITGYEVYRATSADGTYSLLTSVSSTAEEGSTPVTAPTTNGASYYYKVLTVGTKSGYNSGLSVVYATLTCTYAAVSAPTTVNVSTTNVAPGASSTLSWSGASVGTNNAITGYEVYRATSATGSYSLLTTITTTEPEGSTPVTAPTTNGASYYYKIKTLGTMSGYDSGLSGSYAALACTYSAPTAPTTVTLDGSVSVYVLPDKELTLEWRGAADGANNPITGYDIYRDGVLFKSGLTASTTKYTVTSSATAGTSCSYAVVTKGTYSDSTASTAAVVYSYTDPTAPTEVSVSDANPTVGTRVVLSWSGAAAGGYNAITGYRVYRSTEVNGEYKLIANLSSTADSGTCPVDAPSTVGSTYYYRVETQGEISTSGQSTVYATASAVEAPSTEGDITVIVRPTKRKKRGLVLDDYDTAAEGWTLCELSLSEPETQTNYVEVPGRSLGPIDMSTSLTNGDPRYKSRELSARLECSEGTRDERNEVISVMTNKLHGQRVDIVLPDDPTRYITGRVSVKQEYSDMAHASVAISAVCDPWRYNKTETVAEVLVLDEEVHVMLSNAGRRVISPEVTVSGYNASVRLMCGADTWALNEGTYHLSGLTLPQGNTLLTCNGSGTVTFRYREAIL